MRASWVLGFGNAGMEDGEQEALSRADDKPTRNTNPGVFIAIRGDGRCSDSASGPSVSVSVLIKKFRRFAGQKGKRIRQGEGA